MPWKASDVMEQRLEFILEWQSGGDGGGTVSPILDHAGDGLQVVGAGPDRSGQLAKQDNGVRNCV